MHANLSTALFRSLGMTGPRGRTLSLFRALVYGHYYRHGRSLPWRTPALKLRQGQLDPYAIVISEIMLQQTQAARVQQKYHEFLAKFPDFPALARASVRELLAAWQGLGYNRRALRLKSLAKIVVRKYRGKLPSDPAVLEALPGIGYATANSIAAFAFNKPVTFIETNIRTVYLHYFFPNQRTVRDAQIEPIVRGSLDKKNPRRWYWALMDYGAMLKKVQGNANVRSAHYAKQSKFQGSNRQLRGRILKHLLGSASVTARDLTILLNAQERILVRALSQLCDEKFLVKRGQRYMVAR